MHVERRHAELVIVRGRWMVCPGVPNASRGANVAGQPGGQEHL